MNDTQPKLSEQIRASIPTRPVTTPLTTDQRILARITDGIYRQPASALRELISNAYDADATEVMILTDAPRFGGISVRDNGAGLSPEVLEHMIRHIGGSSKRSRDGMELGVTDAKDADFSPGGRQLIGKMGIGLFSVAQFTRHFLIITKTKGDTHRTIADITLGPVAGRQPLLDLGATGNTEIETGNAQIWREKADDLDSHGTEIKLLDLLPRTKAELASEDVWSKIEYEQDDPDAVRTHPPKFHIGRMQPKQSDILAVQPSLPWNEDAKPAERFANLVQAVRDSLNTDSDLVDLESLCDRYLRTIWELALAAPLRYFESHPFDLQGGPEFLFFELEHTARGQAKPLALKFGQTSRTQIGLRTPDGAPNTPFTVIIDGIELSRPILFRDLPTTKAAVTTPLVFVGKHNQPFAGKPLELSGGQLAFEAYLFWAPKVIPKQHQGVILRVGNAAGALFDRTFMNYQISEQTRLRQITAEVFVHEGLDGAINLDRESFNFAHPHYQYLVKWLHSAIRQLTNKHKELGKQQRIERVATAGAQVRAELEQKVEDSLKSRGVDDVPEVVLLEPSQSAAAPALRRSGSIVLHRNLVLAPPASKKTGPQEERIRTAESKAKAIAQLLHGWGLLDGLSYEDQEKLIHDILDILLPEN